MHTDKELLTYFLKTQIQSLWFLKWISFLHYKSGEKLRNMTNKKVIIVILKSELKKLQKIYRKRREKHFKFFAFYVGCISCYI